MVYFATSFLNASGGIMVTASHNPADYNGLKFVREEARPISADTGLADIRQLAEGDDRKIAPKPGSIEHPNIFEDYIEHMLTYVDVERLKPLKLVVNAGNGCAGIAVVGLEKIEPQRLRLSGRMMRTWALPGTVTSTGVSCSTKKAVSSKAITSSVCSPRAC
jgi:hypothetical protein